MTATATRAVASFGDTSAFSRTVAPAVTLTVPPITLRFLPTTQPVCLSATVQSGPTPVNSGQVTFCIVPLLGGKAVGTVTVPAVNGTASTTFNVPATLRPGLYRIVASYHDASGFFPDAPGQNFVLLVALPPDRPGHH